jgi:hypothetical protein
MPWNRCGSPRRRQHDRVGANRAACDGGDKQLLAAWECCGI